MAHLYSGSGQRFLATLAETLERLPSQELLLAHFAVLRAVFAPLRPGGDPDLALDALREEAERWVQSPAALPETRALLDRLPNLAPELAAMRLLSGAGYGLMRPLIDDASICGSLLRRRLAPVLSALTAALGRLRGLDV